MLSLSPIQTHMSSKCFFVYKSAQNYNRYFYTLIRKLCGLVSAPYFLAKDPYALKVCIKSHLFQKKTTLGIVEPMKLPYYCSPFQKKWNLNSSLAQLVRASDC